MKTFFVGLLFVLPLTGLTVAQSAGELGDGVADEFPPVTDSVLPGYKADRSGIKYPHTGDSPPPETEAQKEEKNDDIRRGVNNLFGLTDGSNTNLRNGIAVGLLVLIFIIYRLRGGRKKWQP